MVDLDFNLIAGGTRDARARYPPNNRPRVLQPCSLPCASLLSTTARTMECYQESMRAIERERINFLNKIDLVQPSFEEQHQLEVRV